MAPHSSLSGNLTDLPLISFCETISSRNTIFISSTCSCCIDVIISSPDISVVNFEDTIDFQCKVGWNNGVECVMRGFSVITNYNQPSSLYEYKTKDSVYQMPQPPLVLYLGTDGRLVLKRFIDLRKEFLLNNLGEACLDINLAEEQKINPKNPFERAEISKPGLEKLNESEKKIGFSESVKKNPGFFAEEKKNPFSNTENKNLFSANKASFNDPGKSMSDKTNSFNFGNVSAKNEPNLSFPQKTGENSFFVGKTAQNTGDNKNLLENVSLFPATENLAKLKNLDLSAQPVPAVKDPVKTPEKSFFLTEQTGKPQNFNISGPLMASGSFAFSNPKPADQLKPQDTSKALFLSQTPSTAFSKPPDLAKTSESSSFLKQSSPEPKKPSLINSENPPIQQTVKNSEISKPISISPQKPEISKPTSSTPDKPATISLSKIIEQNEIIQIFLKDMNQLLSQTDSEKVPEASFKLLETKSILYRGKIDTLVDKYMDTAKTVNDLFVNLEEISNNMFFISKYQELQHDGEEENLDIHFIKAVEDTDRSLKLLSNYVYNGIDKAVDRYKKLRTSLGILENTHNFQMKYKKTRTYCPENLKNPVIEAFEARKILNQKIKEIRKELEQLDAKAQSLNKILRKKQQKVYSFSITESDEEINNNVIDFVDPSEYKKFFKIVPKK